MLFEKVNELCKTRGKNSTKLERECGLANATIRRWEARTPNANSLIKVADHFGVSADYLRGRGIYELSEDAQKYAKQFDELPEEKKQLALAYMGVVQAQ